MNTKQSVTKKRDAGRRGPASVGVILGDGSESGRNIHQGLRPMPPFWKAQYRRLMALRVRLEAERNGHAMAIRQPLASFSMDMADAATDEVDHELTLGELSMEQDALYEIDEALKRIANGTYGTCEISHVSIPEARLKALPWTRFTQEAEQQLESSGRKTRPHLGQLRSISRPAETNPEGDRVGEDGPDLWPTDEILYYTEPIPGLLLPGRGRGKKPQPQSAFPPPAQGENDR